MISALRQYVQQSSINGVLFLLLLVFSGAAIFSLLGFIIAEFVFGIPLLSSPELLDNLTNPELIPALRVMQVLQALGMLIIPAGVYIWISSSKREIQTLIEHPKRQAIMLAIAVFMVAFPFINFLAAWNSSIQLPTELGGWMQTKEEQASALTALFLDMPNIGSLVFNIFMIALLPAIGEELIFRGIIQRGLYKKFGNPHLAIWLAAILFSAVHMQFLGFVPRMLMGVAMGYLFFWSKNLWYPTVAHFTNNALAIVLAYGIQHGSIDAHLESAGIDNAGMAAFSLAFCIMLMYLFKGFQELENS